MDRRRLQCFLYLTFWLFWLVRNCLFYLMKIPTNIQIYDPWSQLVIQVHLQVQKEVSACLTSTTENWLVTPRQGEEVREGVGGDIKMIQIQRKRWGKIESELLTMTYFSIFHGRLPITGTPLSWSVYHGNHVGHVGPVGPGDHGNHVGPGDSGRQARMGRRVSSESFLHLQL